MQEAVGLVTLVVLLTVAHWLNALPPMSPSITFPSPNYISSTTGQTTNSRYTDPRYTDPRYTDPRYTDPRYTDPRYTDPRYTDPRYTDSGYFGTGYPNTGTVSGYLGTTIPRYDVRIPVPNTLTRTSSNTTESPGETLSTTACIQLDSIKVHIESLKSIIEEKDKRIEELEEISSQSNQVCKICYTRPCSVLYLPCCHLGMCKTCHLTTTSINEESQEKQCPFCRVASYGFLNCVIP